MRKQVLAVAILMAAAVSLTGMSKAQAAGYLNWISKTCVVVDGAFQVCKPSPSWDTQTKNISEEAVRWVLHREGANPIMKLIYDQNATGKTAHDYARKAKQDLVARGINVSSVQNRVINGRNVSLLSGQSGELNYLVAVYRDQAKGLKLECTGPTGNFSSFANEFMSSINSVRFMR
jgi:hypothetical protein